MQLNPLTGWYHPSVPRKASETLVFCIVFLLDYLHVWTNDKGEPVKHRTFRGGVEYGITGIRNAGSGQLEVMLNTSEIMALDCNLCSIECYTETNGWGGGHDIEYDVNARNRRERRKAIKTGQRAYGYYADCKRDANPLFYVPTRPARNQPNVLTVDADRAMIHATIHQPTPAMIDGKDDTPAEKHPLLDR